MAESDGTGPSRGERSAGLRPIRIQSTPTSQ